LKKDIFLLHGFNVKDGGVKTVGSLLEDFPSAKLVNYGWLGFLGTIFFNDNIAKIVATQITDGCTIIGHSNAADIIYRMSQLKSCPKIDRVILIRPALDSDISFGSNVDRVDVFFHENDRPVGFAKWIPFHNWGSMGESGYKGKDSNVFGHDEKSIFNDKEGGHSDVFKKTKHLFVPYLKNLLKIDNNS